MLNTEKKAQKKRPLEDGAKKKPNATASKKPRLDIKGGVENKGKVFMKNKGSFEKGLKDKFKGKPAKHGTKGGKEESTGPKGTAYWNQKKKESKEALLRRKQSDNKFYQLQQDAKKLWEKLRRSDVRSEEKHGVATELYKLTKGKVVNIIEAHDTSRVIECLYTNGSPEIKNSIFDEVKDKLIYYSKNKYAKNVVLAILRHGSQQHKEGVFTAVQSKVVDLFLHKEASNIISALYDDYCNALKKRQMAQEFYTRELTFFKEDNVTSFKDAYDRLTDKNSKSATLTEFKEKLVRLADKGVVRHGLYHYLLLQCMDVLLLNCSADHGADAVTAAKAELLDFIRQIQHILVEIVHTKEGMQVACKSIWNSTAKERKAIAKSFKPFVNKIAVDDQGHKAILCLLDVVDDTVMLYQSVGTELAKNCEELLADKYGSKVLVYLMGGRDTCVIPSETIDLLKQGDNNDYSKKDPALRRSELRKTVQKQLIELVCAKIEEHLLHGEHSIVVRQIILNADEEGQEMAFKAILEKLKDPYTSESKDHLVENKFSNFALKKFIVHEAKAEHKKMFTKMIKDNLDQKVVSSWVLCNRGAFLLVSLLEIEDSDLRKWLKEALAGRKSEIEKLKSSSKGVELLTEKLQSV